MMKIKMMKAKRRAMQLEMIDKRGSKISGAMRSLFFKSAAKLTDD